ncbi:MAG: hypothetical protein C4K47_08495 [Candidatus Thorarchaeota archaeon]|nr:MAG: hypothetical protein C4K47_08495 [Candidatus Thorarchaeota archaeon]
MRLLDPSIMRYILSGKAWKVGAGDIENEAGEAVGSVKRKLLLMRTEIQVLDTDSSVLCAVHRKTTGLNPVYDVTDAAGRQLGRAKRTAGGFKDFMRMYSTDNEELLRATGNAVRWEFVISNPRRGGGDCATITKAGCWERMSHLGPGFVETYVIDIEDPEMDRLLLLAYAIVVSDASLNV